MYHLEEEDSKQRTDTLTANTTRTSQATQHHAQTQTRAILPDATTTRKYTTERHTPETGFDCHEIMNVKAPSKVRFLQGYGTGVVRVIGPTVTVFLPFLPPGAGFLFHALLL